VIGHRQKKRSSWRPKGSKALAILKILELNGLWQQTCFPAQAAYSDFQLSGIQGVQGACLLHPSENRYKCQWKIYGKK
jgi:hypothetical protein